MVNAHRFFSLEVKISNESLAASSPQAPAQEADVPDHEPIAGVPDPAAEPLVACAPDTAAEPPIARVPDPAAELKKLTSLIMTPGKPAYLIQQQLNLVQLLEYVRPLQVIHDQ